MSEEHRHDPESTEQPEPAPAETMPPPPPPPPPATAPGAPRAGTPFGEKSPILAAFLSFMPGLGNIYNGLYHRGLTFFVIFISLIGVISTTHGPNEGIFIPVMIFFVLFNVFDAYRQAQLINYGYTEDPALQGRSSTFNLGSAGLLPGVVLVVVGTYGLLRKYFDFTLSWLFEQWPIFIIGAGGFLIFKAIQDRRAEESAAAEALETG